MIAVDSATGVLSGNSPMTWSHTCSGTNRVLFVGITAGQTDNVSGVTYDGVAMTQINKVQTPAGSSRYVYLYYLLNPTTGTNTVSVSYSSGAGVGANSVSYTGVRQNGQPDANATNTTTGTSLTGSITTVANNCWAVMVAGSFAETLSAGTGSTLRNQAWNNGAIYDSNGQISPPGVESMTVTVPSSDPMAVIIASFVPEPEIGGDFAYFM